MPNKLIININTPQDGGDRKTGVFPSRGRWKPGRRRLQDGIRFFDVGWMYDGSEWGLLPYVDPNSLVAISDNGANFTNLNVPITEAEFLQRDSHFFDVPAIEWQDTFLQITEEQTQDFQLTVFWNGTGYALTNYNGTTWRDGKFYPPPGAFEGFSSGYFTVESAFAGTSLGPSYKVTEEYDPDASSVAPNLGKSFDVYMMPTIHNCDIASFFPIGESGIPSVPLQIRHDVMMGYTILYPREVIYEPTHPAYGTFPAPGGWTWFSVSGSIGGSYDYDEVYANLIYFRDYWATDARTYRRITNSGVISFSDIGTVDFPEAPYWPAPPSVPDDSGSSNYQLQFVNNFSLQENFTKLQAVIRKQGKNYYVWRIEP